MGAKGQGPKRRAGMIGKRAYGAEVEGGHLSIPAQPFCCPCKCSEMYLNKKQTKKTADYLRSSNNVLRF